MGFNVSNVVLASGERLRACEATVRFIRVSREVFLQLRLGHERVFTFIAFVRHYVSVDEHVTSEMIRARELVVAHDAFVYAWRFLIVV